MIILSWNIRGVRSPLKRAAIRGAVEENQAKLVIFQETKVMEVSRGLIGDLVPYQNPAWVTAEAEGTAGGILIVWDSNLLELEEEIAQHCIGVKFQGQSECNYMELRRGIWPLHIPGETDFLGGVGRPPQQMVRSVAASRRFQRHSLQS
ncbi:hypothetical protein H6P81_018068 [Aristolochia fimbriata]|uniref:Endonuclease/exonuclease/phosphatase domain-containing protein n=1 Tax=Aristolochia fimbriata TaxID=158543 RepID=A0AAV7E166_ARIFI|nr:hypothetical protein H6P81_018068 [Aristolochia fimbriata]